MSHYIPKSLKKLVITRAGHRCEYCRIPEYLSNFEFHIEHIIGIQHLEQACAIYDIRVQADARNFKNKN